MSIIPQLCKQLVFYSGAEDFKSVKRQSILFHIDYSLTQIRWMLKVAEMQIQVTRSHSFMNLHWTSNCEAVILKGKVKIPCLKQSCNRQLVFLWALTIWSYVMLYCFSEKSICCSSIHLQNIKQCYRFYRNSPIRIILQMLSPRDIGNNHSLYTQHLFPNH